MGVFETSVMTFNSKVHKNMDKKEFTCEVLEIGQWPLILVTQTGEVT